MGRLGVRVGVGVGMDMRKIELWLVRKEREEIEKSTRV